MEQNQVYRLNGDEHLIPYEILRSDVNFENISSR